MEPTSHIDFVRQIAEAICVEPEKIEVESSIDEKGVLIKLFVARSDLGRMIGRGGETAQAVRTLLRGLGARNSAHYGLKVDSKEPPEEEAE